MDITEGRYLKIQFVDGQEKTFAFEPLVNTTDPAMVATRVQQMLDSGRIILKAENKLLIIPLANVIAVEISPCPDTAMPHAINVLHEFE